jgi:hypothetical protein
VGWFVKESALEEDMIDERNEDWKVTELLVCEGVCMLFCMKINSKKLQHFTLEFQNIVSTSFQNWTIHCHVMCAFFIQHM